MSQLDAPAAPAPAPAPTPAPAAPVAPAWEPVPASPAVLAALASREDCSYAPTSPRPAGGHPNFDALVEIIWRLRQPDGCPWDRVQTHESIAKNMIEEAFEAVDAIEGGCGGGKRRHLAEELGDVLMEVVLHSQIAADAGTFDIDDVCKGIAEKLVRRHPHVFGEEVASSASDVTALWEQVKLKEHAQAGAQADAVGERREGLLDSVPAALPALMQCQKISKKAVAAGFEWGSIDGVWDQVSSEIQEFKEAQAAEPGGADATMEFGDILFALVNVARWSHIDAESALRASCAKFRRRWEYMEHAAWGQGRNIDELSNDEQEALWAEAKKTERA